MTQDTTQNDAVVGGAPKPATPGEEIKRIDVHIFTWTDGRIQIEGPQNPILLLKLMTDAQQAILNGVIDQANKMAEAKQSRIIRPDGAMVDSRIIEAANEQKS